ncbi:MAG: hypothetical protein QOJ40_2578 [Verrucomicrobiota bacterium]
MNKLTVHTPVQIAIGSLALLLALSIPLRLPAQTNRPAVSGPSNRYLLIMDTSRAMQARADAAVQAAQDLLVSGMGGQLRQGDTIGVWTYDQELKAGKFPLQVWTPETHRAVGKRILQFLSEQKYEKRASLDKVLPAMQDLIKESKFITVILISDGGQKIHGTPFDDLINRFYKLWRAEQRAAHMPFVTVLRARDGVITDHTVNSAPWPIEVPPLPAEFAPPAVSERKPAPVPVQKTAPAALIFSGKRAEAALIFSGKNPESVQPTKPADESAGASRPAQPGNVEANEPKKAESPIIPPRQVSTEPAPAPSTSPAVEPNKTVAAAAKSDAPSAIPSDGDRPSSEFGARAPAPAASNPASWSPPAMPGPTAIGTFLSDHKLWIGAIVGAAIVITFVVLSMRGKSPPSGRVSLSKPGERDQK